MSEEILWKGRPSQLLNIGKHLMALVAVVAIAIGGGFFPPVWFALPLPLLWMLWNFLTVRCRVYELTNERLRLYEGVLNQKIDEIELYRVKDTSDRSHPKVAIEAIADAQNVREKLRKQVEYWRDRKRVREVDFEEGGDLEGDDLLG